MFHLRSIEKNYKLNEREKIQILSLLSLIPERELEERLA